MNTNMTFSPRAKCLNTHIYFFFLQTNTQRQYTIIRIYNWERLFQV